MPEPIVTLPATAGQTEFDVPFPFLSRTHVEVRANGIRHYPVEWVGSARLRLAAPPGAGAFVELRRNTPIEQQLVMFQDGAILTKEDLNTAVQQLLYRQQEVTALYEGTLQKARVHIGEAGGVTVTPEDAANQIAGMVAADQVLADFSQRIIDIDTNSSLISLQSMILSEHGGTLEGQINLTSSLDSALTDLRADHESLSGLVDALANLEDGTGLATIIQSESDARIAGDTALAATLAIIGTKSGDSSSFIVDLNRTKASPTESFAQRFSALSVKDGENAAAILAESAARVTAISAEATARTSLAAALRGETAAAMNTEQEVRSTADSAFAANFALMGAKNPAGTAWILDTSKVQIGGGVALGTRLSGLDSSIGSVSAAVVNEQNARAAADSALSNSLTTVSSTVAGHTSSVSSLLSSVNGINSRWGIQLVSGNRVSGIIMNNGASTSDFTVLVDKFRVINNANGNVIAPFVIEGGVVRINMAYITDLSADRITVGRLNVANLVWDGDIWTNKLANNAVTRMAATYGGVGHDMRGKPQNAWQVLFLGGAGTRVTFYGIPGNSAVKLDVTLDHYRTGGSDDAFYVRVVRYTNGVSPVQVGDSFYVRSRSGYTLTTVPFIDVVPYSADYAYEVELQRYSNHGSVITYVNLAAIVGQK